MSSKKPRLPPGQRLTKRFPILQAGNIPKISIKDWQLRIHGEVEKPLTLTYDELITLPSSRITCDIHCVTSWSKFDTNWEGVLFKEIIKLVQPKPTAKYVIFECADLGGQFTTNVPLDVLLDEDVLLAYKYDDKPLETVHGGPVRGLVPKRYFYKSAKWVIGLKFVKEDEPGYWEKRGYSNSADPWKEDRYSR
ncbi:MAG: sulfite oxidase-like oxidoreductase [Candidatus Hermodarchaeota archaeon]